MCEREHLGGFRVGPVDEDQRGESVGQSESTKFLRVKNPMRVAADDAADHDKNADLLSLLDEQPQCISPGCALPALVDREAEALAHFRRNTIWRCGESCGADERARFLADAVGIVLVPCLAALAGINHVEEVGAGTLDTTTAKGPEIRNRKFFLWRLGEKEVPEWNAGRIGKRFKLLEGRFLFAPVPGR